MKKITTFVFGLTAVCALTACGGSSSKAAGKKVEEAEFEKKAQETQSKEKTFTEAVLTYSILSEGEISGEDAPKVDEKGEAKFTYNNGRWATTENIPAELVQMAGEMVGFDIMEVYEEVDELLDSAVEELYRQYANMGINEDDIKTELNFYEDPIAYEFFLDVDAKFDAPEGSAALDIETYELMEFNDYGLLSRYYMEATINSEATVQGQKAVVDFHEVVDLQVEYK